MSYLDTYLQGDKLKETVNEASEALKKREFDSFAVRGISGLLLGAPLAMEMGKNLLIVRKSVASCHSSDKVEGWRRGSKERIIILDDFMTTGNTVRTIYRKLLSHVIEPKIVGIYFYKQFS